MPLKSLRAHSLNYHMVISLSVHRLIICTTRYQDALTMVMLLSLQLRG